MGRPDIVKEGSRYYNLITRSKSCGTKYPNICLDELFVIICKNCKCLSDSNYPDNQSIDEFEKELIEEGWNLEKGLCPICSSVESQSKVAHKRYTTKDEILKCPLDMYIVYWKSGGSSQCSIGMCSDGTRWIAPTNWVFPARITSNDILNDIDYLESL